ncbi:hypothetical protein KUTeg_011592 [Tegillarca granosa]|uniref:Integrase core domain-containing protein n=1 Tax=Tegillarca granosa TaxID=220873 RepID=A0ABQ9EX42_TEGGR|nr:hypothetical protein KUTeg_011592 [Tegillarca granosa]
MTAVRKRMGCPKRIRADRGTENGHIEQMQRFLRFNHLDDFSYKSYLYGSSNHNQRTEAWWSNLRSHNVQFWINLFQTLKNDDKFELVKSFGLT